MESEAGTYIATYHILMNIFSNMLLCHGVYLLILVHLPGFIFNAIETLLPDSFCECSNNSRKLMYMYVPLCSYILAFLQAPIGKGIFG